jgi:hypothetical protein
LIFLNSDGFEARKDQVQDRGKNIGKEMKNSTSYDA